MYFPLLNYFELEHRWDGKHIGLNTIPHIFLIAVLWQSLTFSIRKYICLFFLQMFLPINCTFYSNSSLNIHVHVSDVRLPFLVSTCLVRAPWTETTTKRHCVETFTSLLLLKHREKCVGPFTSHWKIHLFSSYILFVRHKIKQRMCEKEKNCCLIYKDLYFFITMFSNQIKLQQSGQTWKWHTERYLTLCNMLDPRLGHKP